MQGFYNHLNAAFYVSGAVLDDEHEYTYFHDAYNLVRKTDMYQVTYKYKMTRADIYGEGKHKNEADVIKLP